MSAVIEVNKLKKTYKSPFLRRTVEAVKEVSFQVDDGQVFGFLGPNGAGKTTTIRSMMGIVHPTAGTIKLFGEPAPSRASRQRIGFLPESPYFYDYLTVTELIDLAGRLCGVDKAGRRKRTEELLALVGLEHARNQRLKSYSKGMLQRAGIAQALVHDPDLIVFDEPMTGLDPVGRKEVRDIIVGLSEQGKTVFFSSHILSDVEMICDHVVIVAKGEIVGSGALSELVDTTVHGFDVSLAIEPDFSAEYEAKLAELSASLRRSERELRISVAEDGDVDALLSLARDLGAKVRAVEPRHETLEDLFLAATGQNKKEASS